jgi:hypothetical protein
MQITPQQFEQLLPLAIAWAEEQEKFILKNGVPLSESQVADSKLIPVTHPHLVKLLRVDQIPMPQHPLLKAAAIATNLISPNTIGLTLSYGIFIRSDYWGHRQLVVHELARTAQYERLGGIKNFLQQYLHECVTIGYPAAPMEQEAIAAQKRICP